MFQSELTKFALFSYDDGAIQCVLTNRHLTLSSSFIHRSQSAWFCRENLLKYDPNDRLDTLNVQNEWFSPVTTTVHMLDRRNDAETLCVP